MDVFLSERARKEYEQLPKAGQSKVKKKLKAIGADPYTGKKLVGELTGILSVRAWPYRILYEINLRRARIEVHKISHRQGACK